ncbi:hypothetical protein M406DRAFT_101770 [Cryphonectria parasitica EP155]|uniref:Uncharacterized protein n=1 Tax=Cryphonectria parasitica (strain ATCC 38755 / EP155) TaxID=660469 RepID=A0A9P4Y504_CRYP1|nr:uncharacterized protein M406DRAFT_101770 [Cryphonectria parasitica EP155]KAF3766600.1 hypothetical protein M406DRAFT_101770 [Cryphonectria parasitica EP155]
MLYNFPTFQIAMATEAIRITQFRTPTSVENNISSTEKPQAYVHQDIPDRRINAEKLTALLSSKFPVNSYEIRVIRNVYSITAPANLSLNDIASCRF